MRLISQDGTIDVPYDSGSLTICIGKYEDIEIACIYYHNFSTTKGTKLAEYKSKKKAQKAMGMLHKEYGKHFFGQCGAVATANLYVPAFAFIPQKVFQFPQDEDVEV